MKTKKCTKCGENKQIKLFHNAKQNNDGHKNSCKECDSIHDREYREKNKAHGKKVKSEYYEKNKDKIRGDQKKYHLENKEKINKKNRKWYESNKDKVIAYQKEWLSKNKRYKQYSDKIYREENIEKIRIRSRKYQSKRMLTDIKYNISKRISHRLRKSLQKMGINKTNTTFDILGYSKDDAVKHLKKTLIILNTKSKNDYTWDDYLSGDLHIDHILPIAKFNYKSTDDDEFKRCWGLENLQLLPAKENHDKHDKCANFQTSMFGFMQ